MLSFFINPIGASEVDPGRIEFKPGANPSAKPCLNRATTLATVAGSMDLPTLIGRLQNVAGGLPIRGFAASRVTGGFPFRTPTEDPGCL